MEPKELVIIPPEGYEIDKEKSTIGHVVFKPIFPESWEEFCQCINPEMKVSAFDLTLVLNKVTITKKEFPIKDFNLTTAAFGSKKLLDQIWVYMRLLSIYKYWVRNSCIDPEYIYPRIMFLGDILCVAQDDGEHPFMFPNVDMANHFLDCYSNELQFCKGLF